MQFTYMPPSQIDRIWPAIADILAPAVRQDATDTIEGLHKRLHEGADWLFEISGPGYALMVFEKPDGTVFWTKYLAGKIEGGPKERVSIIRQAVDHIEKVAREAGCKEHRLCGRDWARVLPNYKPFEGERNGLRKGLV